MTQKGIGTVIARRDLSVSDGQKVIVEIGKPYTDSDGATFCPYRIKGLGKPRLGRAGGVDTIHALQMAFQKIGIDIFVMNNGLDRPISWDAGETGDIGFPFPTEIQEILND
jgi:hypothetical protein